MGYLPQEPELDPSKDVRGNVEEGVGETKALVDEFNEISMKFAEPMDDDEMNRLLERQGSCKAPSTPPRAGIWSAPSRSPPTPRLPPWDADVTKLSGGERRRVALCRCYCRTRTCCCSTTPTTSMRNRWAGSAFLTEYPNRGGHHPRSLLP